MKNVFDFGKYFHQTFPPTPAYIGRILSIAQGKPRSVREIADLTGIPQGKSSGKVVPHLKYAVYMGLIESDITAPMLTPLGEIIRTEDWACSEPLTQWLLHCRLASCTGAPMWYYFVRMLLNQNQQGISRAYLLEQMQIQFGITKFPPLLTTYQEFSAIDYLSTDSKTTIAIAPQRIEQNYLYLYGYVLLHEWEAALPRTSEITADELNALACATVLGLTENQWFEVLEMLASHGICRINKQLSPFTLVRLADTQMIIPKLYTLLL